MSEVGPTDVADVSTRIVLIKLVTLYYSYLVLLRSKTLLLLAEFWFHLGLCILT